MLDSAYARLEYALCLVDVPNFYVLFVYGIINICKHCKSIILFLWRKNLMVCLYHNNLLTINLNKYFYWYIESVNLKCWVIKNKK